MTYAKLEGNRSFETYSCFKYLSQKGIPREQLVYYSYKHASDSAADNGLVIFKLKE